MPPGLANIEHIVVLMLENRSFDNMLGYLSLPEEMGGKGRDDVDGLKPGMSNPGGPDGDIEITRYDHRTAITKAEDPKHDGAHVDEQLAADESGEPNKGFVKNYLRTRRKDLLPKIDPAVPMTYHTPDSVPVFDFVAENFLICDRWFSSVPGATFPNRLYSLAGEAAGKRENEMPPIYDKRSVMRFLEEAGVEWRWYSTDPATLRGIDGRYRARISRELVFFDKRTIFVPKNFFDDLRNRELPKLAWIDPNFVDLPGGGGSNDDHPPADILAGQELVLKIYNGIVGSDHYWDKTLFFVYYDEHGGFFDHVQPDSVATPPDDDPRFRHYGLRVPAFVVSPYVKPGAVSSTVFDHTSLIKTILQHFCGARAGEFMGQMNRRVREAADLSELLTESTPREAPAIPRRAYDIILESRIATHRKALEQPLPVGTQIVARPQDENLFAKLTRRGRDLLERVFNRRTILPSPTAPPPTGLVYEDDPDPAHPDLDQEIYAMAQEVRRQGVPAGRP